MYLYVPTCPAIVCKSISIMVTYVRNNTTSKYDLTSRAVYILVAILSHDDWIVLECIESAFHQDEVSL